MLASLKSGCGDVGDRILLLIVGSFLSGRDLAVRGCRLDYQSE